MCHAQLASLVSRGGEATVCMFGQTGSGKTHSTAGILSATAKLLFQAQPGAQLRLQSFEVAGRACRDLLNSSEAVPVLEDEEGYTQVCTAHKHSHRGSNCCLARRCSMNLQVLHRMQQRSGTFCFQRSVGRADRSQLASSPACIKMSANWRQR